MRSVIVATAIGGAIYLAYRWNEQRKRMAAYAVLANKANLFNKYNRVSTKSEKFAIRNNQGNSSAAPVGAVNYTII